MLPDAGLSEEDADKLKERVTRHIDKGLHGQAHLRAGDPGAHERHRQALRRDIN